MSQLKPTSAVTVAPSMTALGTRALWLFGSVLVVGVGLWLALTWHTILQRQVQRMGVATALAAADADGYFTLLGARAQDVAGELLRIDVLRNPRAALPVLRRFNADSPDFGGATVILPDGHVLVSSARDTARNLPNILNDPSWRADFAQTLRTNGLTIGRPHLSNLLHKWVIPVCFAARDKRGQALFVVQFGILLERQRALWKRLQLMPGVAFGLARDDGYLISRLSDQGSARNYAGRDRSTSLDAALRLGRQTGSYDEVDTNGRSRIGVYDRLIHYPLYVFLSVPRSAAAAIWWQYARFPLYMLAGGFVFGIVLYGIVAGRFARRMRLIGEFLVDDEHASNSAPPSSGVREIDLLCGSLAEARRRLNQAAENREKLLLSAVQAGTYVVRKRDDIVIDANDAFVGMLGKSRALVIGSAWTSLLAGPARPDHPKGGAGPYPAASLRFDHAGGKPLWLSIAEYTEESQGDIMRNGLAIDVSEREQLLTEVHSQSRRMQALWRVAADRTLADSEKIRLILGFGVGTLGMETALIGEISGERYIVRHVIDAMGLFEQDQDMRLEDMLCQVVARDDSNLYIANVAADERFRDYLNVRQMGINTYVSAAIRLEDKIYGTLVFLRRKPADHVFTEDDKAFIDLLASWLSQLLQQQKRRAELEAMAMSDSLTALPNRRAAEIRINNELARVRRGGDTFAVAICDLDNFKLVNDHFGHKVGDIVLRHVADVIQRALRDGDWVARWGGEEFIVFFYQSSPADALAASERIRQAIRSQPVEEGQTLLEVTASFGIGVLSGLNQDIGQVLLDADDCLYEAKKRGRDCVVAADMASSHTLRRSHMLQQALQEKRLLPAYQCMVDLRTETVVAEEALARLALSNGDILPAAEFIEAAEGLNLIHRVDNLIARQAMERCSLRQTQSNDHADFTYFINLSPQFLARKDMVEALLRDADVLYAKCSSPSASKKSFVFEITERQFVSDLDRLRADLQPLLDFGFRLALDDFGSGYSSFLYLAKLPVSFLKIEGWMIQNMLHSAHVLQMVKSVTMLAKTLGVTTIAESVENRETADALRNIGVDWAQGYFFGTPQCDTASLARSYGS